MERRDFLQFLGVSSVALTMSESLLARTIKKPLITKLPSLAPSTADELQTISGLDYRILMRWGDKINATQKFGYNNDFIALHSLSDDNAILWINHEYMLPLFVSSPERTKKNVDIEQLEVGGSLIEVKKDGKDWKFVADSKYNRRLDATTPIPLISDRPIMGSKIAIGTLANCAGGKTPWGTFLTCEENYDMAWGERYRDGKRTESYDKWDSIYDMPPEHYGWVVEIEPPTGKAKKLTSLGRMAHECAAVTRAKNGKVVAYTGDDTINEHLYKFISDSTDSLEKGKLYVANLEKGQWISLDINDQPELKKTFKDQTDVLIYTREAAKIVGATPLDRPEDIEFDPLTGHVFVALTNNKSKNNFHGSILKIKEDGDDPGSLTFKHEVFITGGTKGGFSCPDNMVFDPKGNLWFTSDISGSAMGKPPYVEFGNNSLFVFIRSGEHAGEIVRVANAPVDAEFTGPCFSPDYKTLFLSVQHPGEQSKSKENPTSHWPDGVIPKPSVVTLSGSFLDKVIEGKV